MSTCWPACSATVADLVLDADNPPATPRSSRGSSAPRSAPIGRTRTRTCRPISAIGTAASEKCSIRWRHSRFWNALDRGNGRRKATGSRQKTGPTARQFKIDVFLVDKGDLGEDGLPSEPGLTKIGAKSTACLVHAGQFASRLHTAPTSADIWASEQRANRLPIGRFRARKGRSESSKKESICENRGSIAKRQWEAGRPDCRHEPAEFLTPPCSSWRASKRVGSSYIARTGAVTYSGEARGFRLKAYSEAIKALWWRAKGSLRRALFDQAIAFTANLLEVLRGDARKDECRKKSLGTHPACWRRPCRKDKPEAAIVTPWHPYPALLRRQPRPCASPAAIGQHPRTVDHSQSPVSIRRFAPWNRRKHRLALAPRRSLWHRRDRTASLVHRDGQHMRSSVCSKRRSSGKGADAAFDGYSREAAAKRVHRHRHRIFSACNLTSAPTSRCLYSMPTNRECPRRAWRNGSPAKSKPKPTCGAISSYPYRSAATAAYLRRSRTWRSVANSTARSAGEATKTFLSQICGSVFSTPNAVTSRATDGGSAGSISCCSMT